MVINLGLNMSDEQKQKLFSYIFEHQQSDFEDDFDIQFAAHDQACYDYCKDNNISGVSFEKVAREYYAFWA